MQDNEHEFELTSTELQRICNKAFGITGIVLGEQKKPMIYSRLVRRLRALNLTSFTDYLDFVDKDAGELTNFINSLTTNLTSFFRESHHFTFLKEYLQKLVAEGKPIRIWSAGCSAGMEPYSIAMVAAEVLGVKKKTYDFKILATDIDTEMLKKCRNGLYSLEEKKNIPPEYFAKYCKVVDDEGEEKIQISQELRNMIAFNQLNLLSNWPIKKKIQIAFCRNVIIYFDKPTQDTLFEKFHKVIENDGILIIGHSETIGNKADLFQLIAKTTYKRIG